MTGLSSGGLVIIYSFIVSSLVDYNKKRIGMFGKEVYSLEQLREDKKMLEASIKANTVFLSSRGKIEADYKVLLQRCSIAYMLADKTGKGDYLTSAIFGPGGKEMPEGYDEAEAIRTLAREVVELLSIND